MGPGAKLTRLRTFQVDVYFPAGKKAGDKARMKFLQGVLRALTVKAAQEGFEVAPKTFRCRWENEFAGIATIRAWGPDGKDNAA